MELSRLTKGCDVESIDLRGIHNFLRNNIEIVFVVFHWGFLSVQRQREDW